MVAKAIASTMQVLFKMLAWSLSACMMGRHPMQDWDGEDFPEDSYRYALRNKPLTASGFTFAVVGLCADLDELCNEFKLNHFNSLSPCFWCGANCSDAPWIDFSDDASWKMSLYAPPARRNDVRRPNGHPVWTIPGLSRFSVLWDIMHGLDLGPTCHVIGNTLVELCLDRRLGRTMETRCSAIWLRIQARHIDPTGAQLRNCLGAI